MNINKQFFIVYREFNVTVYKPIFLLGTFI